jgi:hypothetical protein
MSCQRKHPMEWIAGITIVLLIAVLFVKCSVMSGEISRLKSEPAILHELYNDLWIRPEIERIEGLVYDSDRAADEVFEVIRNDIRKLEGDYRVLRDRPNCHCVPIERAEPKCNPRCRGRR